MMYLTHCKQAFIAGSPHKDLVGGNDDRHSHLQTCGVFLLAAAHLDQPYKVQVINLTVNIFNMWMYGMFFYVVY